MVSWSVLQPLSWCALLGFLASYSLHESVSLRFNGNSNEDMFPSLRFFSLENGSLELSHFVILDSDFSPTDHTVAWVLFPRAAVEKHPRGKSGVNVEGTSCATFLSRPLVLSALTVVRCLQSCLAFTVVLVNELNQCEQSHHGETRSLVVINFRQGNLDSNWWRNFLWLHSESVPVLCLEWGHLTPIWIKEQRSYCPHVVFIFETQRLH